MGDAALPRGTVTFLFSDIEESTELLRRVGDEQFAVILSEQRRLLRAAFAAHGGHEIDTAGDGFFVAFESARSAVQAAIDAQLAVGRAPWPEDARVRVRIGLHTAEPHLAAEGYVGVGVHRAARICDAARGGQILLSNATAGIVDDADLPDATLTDLGEHSLKGLPRPQRLFQLVMPALRGAPGPPRTPQAAARTPGPGTFLHADLTGWRHVMRVLGDEASGELAADYHAAVGAVVEAHRGVTLERVADRVYAIFADALDAVRAADAVRTTLAEFAWPAECDVDVRIALHSGRWSGDVRRPGAGTALFRVSRLTEAAEPGQIVVSDAAAAMLEGDPMVRRLGALGERSIQGFDEPVRLFELTA